jgi:hypothetical protein
MNEMLMAVRVRSVASAALLALGALAVGLMTGCDGEGDDTDDASESGGGGTIAAAVDTGAVITTAGPGGGEGDGAGDDQGGNVTDGDGPGGDDAGPGGPNGDDDGTTGGTGAESTDTTSGSGTDTAAADTDTTSGTGPDTAAADTDTTSGTGADTAGTSTDTSDGTESDAAGTGTDTSDGIGSDTADTGTDPTAGTSTDTVGGTGTDTAGTSTDTTGGTGTDTAGTDLCSPSLGGCGGGYDGLRLNQPTDSSVTVSGFLTTLTDLATSTTITTNTGTCGATVNVSITGKSATLVGSSPVICDWTVSLTDNAQWQSDSLVAPSFEADVCCDGLTLTSLDLANATIVANCNASSLNSTVVSALRSQPEAILALFAECDGGTTTDGGPTVDCTDPEAGCAGYYDGNFQQTIIPFSTDFSGITAEVTAGQAGLTFDTQAACGALATYSVLFELTFPAPSPVTCEVSILFDDPGEWADNRFTGTKLDVTACCAGFTLNGLTPAVADVAADCTEAAYNAIVAQAVASNAGVLSQVFTQCGGP